MDIESIERRLSAGESLRKIAIAMGLTYQALQYHRRKAGKTPLRAGYRSGAEHASWRGGSFTDCNGYKMVRCPERGKANPYVPEHILLAEQMVGRQLRPGEHVHHINGDKTDNSPLNLLVVTASEHRILHRQLEQIAIELVREGAIVFTDGRYQRVRG